MPSSNLIIPATATTIINSPPYTTLFRSLKRHPKLDQHVREQVPIYERAHRHHQYQQMHRNELDVGQHLQSLGLLLRRDRKSTRLNSSHVAISYAVFCLKQITETVTKPIL